MAVLEVNYENFLKLLDRNATIDKIKENSHATEALKNICEGKMVYIWPAGKIGNRIYEEMENNGYKNIKLIDKNNSINNTISPENMNFSENDVLIIASLRYGKEIYNRATLMNCKHIIMYYHVKEIMKPVIFPEDFYDQCFESLSVHLLDNVEDYKAMYFCLEDERSRLNFLNNMFFRLTFDIRYTFQYDTKLQYFGDVVSINPDAVLVDAGGYNGDTLKQFLTLHSLFKSYYLFEPDIALLEEAKLISSNPKIKYINKGLFSKPKSMRFNKTKVMDGGGKITEDGDDIIEVTSVDEFITEEVTFIKMDIEGTELEALKGSKDTIIKYSPSLAICIYHKPSDYLDIFKYIREINPNYKFFIRHHEDFYAETVLYAIEETNINIIPKSGVLR
ncbi:FkbM family methyltransferase [Paenibacillus intestini]|nr:FkbM family methyltransferase [Paenibacillus intestini]